jgi:cellular nucleic acid-binding protein
MDREEKEDSFKCYNCEGAGHMARNCTSSKRKDSFKCYNCGGAGHMARYCTAPKKKEARKSAGPAGSCGSEVMGPYPKRQGGGD